MPHTFLCACVASALTFSLVAFTRSLEWIHPNAELHQTKEQLFIDELLSHAQDNQTLDTFPSSDSSKEAMKDALCGGCRSAKIDSQGTTCGQIIVYDDKNNPQNAEEVANNHSACARCDPNFCSEHEKNYWRLDHASPKVVFEKTHNLEIPDHFRLPYLNNENETEYFANLENRQPNRAYYFDYNPSLAHLPKDQIPDDLPLNRSYYIGIFRLSSVHECLAPEEQKILDPESQVPRNRKEMVAFVIMDENLKILRQSIKFQQNYMDNRIFNLNGRLYLGYMHHISPIYIRPPENSSKFMKMGLRHGDGPEDFGRQDFDVYIRNVHACCTSSFCKGKNFNYFVDQNGKILVETKPMDPHIVEPMSDAIQTNCRGHSKRVELLKLAEEATLGRGLNGRYVDETGSMVYVTQDLPAESFHTQDELYFSQHGVYEIPFTAERGTACCVRIPDPRYPDNDEKYLLSGISHSKLPAWPTVRALLNDTQLDVSTRAYLSRWYAMEPFAPYRIVARSGKFCFGFPRNTNMENHQRHPRLSFLKHRPLRMNHTELSCPLISFASTIVEAIDNPAHVIVGYGINDCVSNMVKIEKEEIVRQLFGPSFTSLHRSE